MLTMCIKGQSLQEVQPPWSFEISEEQTTFREIIRHRLYQEISEYQAKKRS